MYFAKALFVCASLVASTLSQSTSSRIAFTVLPSTITAGQDVTLHWSGGDGSAVTLTLQKGTSDNLKTVQLVTGDATGTSFTWPVPKSLPNGDNYAFRIQQGDSEPNYTGMITITGGSAASASSETSASASGSKASASASNSSTIATVTANATTTKSVGTVASASGTGTSIARNTTLSIATLSATASSSTSSNPSVGGSGGAPTGSSSAPSPSKTGGAASLVASNFALLVCVIVGLVYLG